VPRGALHSSGRQERRSVDPHRVTVLHIGSPERRDRLAGRTTECVTLFPQTPRSVPPHPTTRIVPRAVPPSLARARSPANVTRAAARLSVQATRCIFERPELTKDLTAALLQHCTVCCKQAHGLPPVCALAVSPRVGEYLPPATPPPGGRRSSLRGWTRTRAALLARPALADAPRPRAEVRSERLCASRAFGFGPQPGAPGTWRRGPWFDPVYRAPGNIGL
jgi:hypothetical protein